MPVAIICFFFIAYLYFLYDISKLFAFIIQKLDFGQSFETGKIVSEFSRDYI